ncbi:MAG TPA: M1 family metallopeptidase, partial [Segetibacter sp.]
MKRIVLLSFGYLLMRSAVAQNNPPAPVVSAEYRATAEKINDLVHTKLDVKFDYQKSYLYGKAWISLKPHFYATDSLRLDAKGMNINQVAIVKNGRNTTLKYTYDSLHLNIDLDKSYKAGEQYTIYIDYTAKPNEFDAKGSAAITDAKGLYFINPKGEIKDKPTQIWTQGETEANSVWFPTIDRPNQKTTEEIYMTVPAKYVTLSNGKMISQKSNADGTRTDYWKMDQPHSPYLFFMGVGDFAIIKDSYKGKEVAYYVEKEYASVARKIFGKTPAMMALFSRLTGVDYPWIKYDQIVGRDYVSGAMENTTATLHQQSAQQDARQLVDNNAWEEVIAHELFHQWFGDYVTTESWSNITLNESFATIGSQLWNEYNYGKDEGDQERYTSTQG